jgi:hypothetical protein
MFKLRPPMLRKNFRYRIIAEAQIASKIRFPVSVKFFFKVHQNWYCHQVASEQATEEEVPAAGYPEEKKTVLPKKKEKAPEPRKIV